MSKVFSKNVEIIEFRIVPYYRTILENINKLVCTLITSNLSNIL